MSTPDWPSQTIGWFGKIPALGDFVGRGLPASLLRPWDDWLSAELSESRRLLADDWAAAYRRAPVLGFLLAPGVLDGHGWQGILLPSMDRVGREFPLTIMQWRSPLAAQAPEPEWWESLASVGKQVLEGARSKEAVDESLQAFVRRQPTQIESVESAGRDVPVVRDLTGSGRSAWWCVTERESPTQVPRVFDGLPRGAALRGLLGFEPE